MEKSAKTSTSSSVSPKKGGFFEFLSCCAPSKEIPEEYKLNKRATIPMHPATTISMDQSKSVRTINADADSTALLRPANDTEASFEASFLRNDQQIGKVALMGSKDKIVAKINLIAVEKKESTQQMITRMISSVKSRDSFDTPKTKKKENNLKDSIIKSVKRTFSKNEDPVDFAHQPQITSQDIAIYIAQKLKCDIIIDALCGFGGNTIQFANFCNYVIAIDSHADKIACARQNVQKNLASPDTIDFMNMDFLKIKKLSGDIVFLHPTDTRKNKSDSFSVFKNLEPEFPELLTKSLEISHCVAIKLPYETDLNELASVFHVTFEKNRLHKKRFCIEIEKISDSEKNPECIMVYFGDLSSIEQKEEYEVIYDYLFCNETDETKKKVPLPAFITILEKIGIAKFFRYLAESEAEAPKNYGDFNDARFSNFIAYLTNKELFTQEDLKKMIEEEPKNPSSSLKSASNSYNSALMALKKNSSVLNDPIRSALQDERKKWPSKGFNPRYKTNLGDESDSRPDDERSMENRFKNLNSTPPSSMRPADRFDTENNEEYKNSHEVSELVVSSYSVDSNYLEDSHDEENEPHVRKSSKPKREKTETTTPRFRSSLRIVSTRNKDVLETVDSPVDLHQLNQSVVPEKVEFEVEQNTVDLEVKEDIEEDDLRVEKINKFI